MCGVVLSRGIGTLPCVAVLCLCYACAVRCAVVLCCAVCVSLRSLSVYAHDVFVSGGGLAVRAGGASFFFLFIVALLFPRRVENGVPYHTTVAREKLRFIYHTIFLFAS